MNVPHLGIQTHTERYGEAEQKCTQQLCLINENCSQFFCCPMFAVESQQPIPTSFHSPGKNPFWYEST
jgi:hypothetical protein